MNKPLSKPVAESEFAQAERRWQAAYEASASAARNAVNRSGIELKSLYTPQDWSGARYLETLGFPGEYPHTRGIYASMHRGRSWTQRQLIGLGVPEDYNARLKALLAHGASAISFIPCNSVFRGYDADEVPEELLGTCGTVVNTVEDMDRALADVPLERISCALNDPSPFTLLALLLAVALPVTAAIESFAFDSPEQEARFKQLSGQLRCLVCQNETIADSRADLAKDLRSKLREQMAAGKTDEEIIAFMTDRYGDFVLYRPPLKATTVLLWAGPFLLLAVGVLIGWRVIRARARAARPQPLSAAERERAERLLRGEGDAR